MISRVGLIGLVTIFGVIASVAAANADPAFPSAPVPMPSRCVGSASASAGDGAFRGAASQDCDGATGDERAAVHGKRGRVAAVLYRQIDCGPPVVIGPAVVNRRNFCNLVRDDCQVGDVARLPRDPRVTTLALLRSTDNSKTWVYDGSNCRAVLATPRVTPLLVRQEIEKLVPHPGIGVAPPGGKTLVNVQTVLWADTPADRDLGTVTLLGLFQVGLRVHVAQVVWDFGDGATDVVDGPGVPYRKGEHCATVSCPGHYGHVYRGTGRLRITSQVRWSGQYSVNGGAWQNVAGTVDGPTARTQVTVVQARGVLVADPTPS
jgi:hypothetical protein